MAYQLISFVLCPYVQRSVITLKEKRVPFEITYIDLDNPPEWFPAISPMGKVPVLRVDQDRVLFESAVINEYLDETNPPPLHPQDPWRRAHNRAWIEFGSNLIGRQYRMLTVPDEPEYVRERDGFLTDLRYVEQQLGEGPFFNGAAFSLADAAMRRCSCVWRSSSASIPRGYSSRRTGSGPGATPCWPGRRCGNRWWRISRRCSARASR